MQVDVVQIGNSRGIRLPAAILKQCGIISKVELEIEHDRLVIKPVKSPRQSWSAAFKRMSQQDDEGILIQDELDTDLLEEWDAK